MDNSYSLPANLMNELRSITPATVKELTDSIKKFKKGVHQSAQVMGKFVKYRNLLKKLVQSLPEHEPDAGQETAIPPEVRNLAQMLATSMNRGKKELSYLQIRAELIVFLAKIETTLRILEIRRDKAATQTGKTGQSARGSLQALFGQR